MYVGTAYLTRSIADCPFSKIACPSFEEVSTDKRCYAQAAILQYDEHDAIRGRAIIQPHGDRLLVVNPPAAPLSTAEFDRVYELPYTRDAHPMYAKQGGVAALMRCVFPSFITAAVLAAVIFAPWPFIREG